MFLFVNGNFRCLQSLNKLLIRIYFQDLVFLLNLPQKRCMELLILLIPLIPSVWKCNFWESCSWHVLYLPVMAIIIIP